VQWSGSQKETRRITLVEYGDPQGFSAMARLVGLPTAIAAEMLLEGHMSKTGVIEPLYPEIYEPILEKLKEESVTFKVMSHS
jgi:saccharopine dehydrogenase-like NADP-dependent oxidoreductase